MYGSLLSQLGTKYDPDKIKGEGGTLKLRIVTKSVECSRRW